MPMGCYSNQDPNSKPLLMGKNYLCKYRDELPLTPLPMMISTGIILR